MYGYYLYVSFYIYMKTWHTKLKKLLTLYKLFWKSKFWYCQCILLVVFIFNFFSLFLKTNQTEKNMCKYLVITYSALKHDWKASSFSYYLVLCISVCSSSEPSKKRRMDGWKAQRKKKSLFDYIRWRSKPTASSLYVFMDFY